MKAPVVVMMGLDLNDAMIVEAAYSSAMEVQGLLDPVLSAADVLVFGGSDADLRWVADEHPHLRLLRFVDPEEDLDAGPPGCAHEVVVRPPFVDDVEGAVGRLWSPAAPAQEVEAPAANPEWLKEPLPPGQAVWFDDEEPAPEDELASTWFDDEEPEAASPTPSPDEELAATGAIWFDDEEPEAATPTPSPDEELAATGAIWFDDEELEEPEVEPRSAAVDADVVAAALGTLPSLPKTYLALCAEMERDSCSMRSVARVIERDVAVAGRLLTVVNSALYALPRKVVSLSEAASLLGMASLRDLVLAVEVFDALGVTVDLPGISLDDLQARAHARASLARGLAPRGLADAAYTVGLLRDVGRMMMVAHAPDRYIACCYLLQADLTLDEGEFEVFGVRGPALGAHLLAQWGLPSEVVEAIGGEAVPGEPTVAGVVALAERFVDEAIHERDHDDALLLVTRDMLEPMNLMAKADLARTLARTMAQGLVEPPVRSAA